LHNTIIEWERNNNYLQFYASALFADQPLELQCFGERDRPGRRVVRLAPRFQGCV
jgi:hypothetical protein